MTLADLSALVRLEHACWAPELRASEARLRQRIERYASGQLSLEMDGRVAAVIYSQRIADASVLRGATSDDVEAHHVLGGRIAQFLAINVLPELQHLGLGDQLLSFVLQLCAHTEGVEHLLAVSLCRDYRSGGGVRLEDYIRRRDDSGLLSDPILRFHEAHGAIITGLVPGYRPADVANLGHGVLVEYSIDALRNRSARTAVAAVTADTAPAAGSAGHGARSIVEACIRQVKPNLSSIPASRPLMECGFDSLDLMRLRAALSERFAARLNPAFFFSHNTADAIVKYFQSSREPVAATPRVAPAAARHDEVAVVGMACRLPGGIVSTDQFWALLSEGRDAISEVPRSRWDIDAFCGPDREGRSIVTRFGGFLDDVDQFDAAFFNIGAEEANALDPQQRLLLEVAWEALEHAGVDPTSLAGARAGIFIGISSHDYELLQVKRSAGVHGPYYATGSAASITAGRLAYVLGCQGPALAIDTACSSSLVAVHLARRSLLSEECDIALAGGVNLMLSPELSVSFSTAGMLAPDGRCKTFDAAADGYVRSEGCGLVVLKRLSHAVRDGDNVLAIIRGSAINHDGFSNGLTAPNGRSQAHVIREALSAAGVAPVEVSYVEAHGTGTPLGDPVEVRALAEVYCDARDATQPLIVGSVKANIGHPEAAAGIAGLIKVVLAQQHRHVPRQLHYREPNPELELDTVPIVIPAQGMPWPPSAMQTPLVAGISSFGFSGTNAHVIVAAPPVRASVPGTAPREWHAFTLSAASRPALKALAARFEAFLATADLSIDELCHTVNTGRAHLEYRLGAVVRSTGELATMLRRFREDAPEAAVIVGRVSRTAADRARRREGSWPATRDGVIALVARHVAGDVVDWHALNDGHGLRKVALPTYPFEHRRYWLADEPQIERPSPAVMTDVAPVSLDNLLYQVEWRERASDRDVASGLLSPRVVADRLSVPARPNVSCAGLASALEELSVTYIAEAFRSLGWDASAGTAPDFAALGVVSEQRRFAAWLMAIHQSATVDTRGGRAEDTRRALATQYPAADAELTMLGRCASRLADVLRGTVDPVGLLFPDADLTDATRLYEASPTFAPMNRLLCDAVREAAGALPHTSRLRVLEVGAGTGGTTTSLLRALDGRISEYVFSDVSPLFVGKARERFGDVPFVSYRALDVESDPAAQGWSSDRFDLVIASNVLHATRDLRSTLRHVRSLVAPGGMLVLVEGTRHAHWVDLIFGMLGGWWRFADHDLRPTCPLLPAATWQRVLAEAGFNETTALVPAEDSGLFEQAVLLARAPEAAAAMPAVPTTSGRHWIVFADSQGIGGELAERLAQHGDTCTQVSIPQDGQPPGRDGLAPLASLRPYGCVHLWSLDAPDAGQLSVEALEATNTLNGASVLHLAQALIAAELAQPPRLWLVTRGAVAAGDGALPGVAQSSLVGLGQVLSAEHPEFRCTHVDLDHAASRSDSVDRLAAELLSDADARRIAVRGSVRLEAQVARLSAGEIAGGDALAIHADRAYLIAGGLGALGLEVAQLLVDRGARHLVLVSRSGVAARGSRAAAAVEQLERQGATVRLVAADISRPGDVHELVRAMQPGPALAGVIHAAGVFDDRLLADHDWSLFRRVLAAKVSGAWNLHLATREMPLDFFALFGSATTVICSSGLGNYVAANSFLDALAGYRRALGLPAVSIGWGPWAGVGMAEAVGSARQAQWANEGLATIDRRQALEVFARVLGRGPAAVAVMAMDWRRYAERHPDAAPSTFLAEVANTVANDADTAIRRPAQSEDAARLAQQLRALPAPERRARLVTHISTAIANVLALPIGRAIDPDQGLFRMGMDSLTSMELRNRLQKALDCSLPPTLTFKYPTVRELADYLSGRLGAAPEPVAVTPVVAAAAVAQPPANVAEPIAIVGVGCRFPGGVSSPGDFWELLRGGVDAIRELPVDRWDIEDYYHPTPGTPGKTYTRRGGYLDRIDAFDPAFFGISPREAASMDPQHRLFLEVCWEALEHAGIPPTSLAGTRSAVFAGIGQDDYAQRRLRSGAVTEIDHYDGTGNLLCFAPGRLSYFLGLRGPNMAIDTACSSSLVAVQLAVQSLRNRDCDLALAGAVHLAIAPDVTLFLSQARVLSPDGRCKTFDAHADGFGRGEGSGTVVLKRLSDAVANGDRVLALIRGAAVNHDGRSSGLTVPSETAQTEVIQQALKNGGVEPAQVSYVEAHGTGTSLGDPIEVNALVGALCADRPAHAPLLIGSVKTNVGHLEAAAGMAGLIKVVLAMQHDELPAHLHFVQPSPHIAWDQIPVEVSATRRRWRREGASRIAGISSFGFSGTNAHVLIEDAPEPAPRPSPGRGLHVLPLSARSDAALRRLAERYHRHLTDHPDQNVSDLCGTASVGRSHFRHRLAVVAPDAIGILQRLAAFLAGTPAAGLRFGETTTTDGDPGRRPLGDLAPDQIADAFVAGVNVDWTEMYPRGSFHIVDLPTYPFERERYWIDAPARRPITPIVFEASVGTTSPAYLDHHRLFGVAVYPAAAFIDLALAAGRSRFGAAAFALDDIEILRPLVLPDTGTVTVRTTLTPEGAGRYSFAIQSVATDVDPVTHVSGRMTECESSLAAPTDVAAERAACEEALDVPGFYREFAERGISFGDDFQAIRELHRRAGRSVAAARLPAGLAGTGTGRLHPVLLDACFQSAMAAWPVLRSAEREGGPAAGRSAAYVPVSIERVEAARAIASEIWSVATPRPAHGLGGGRVVDLDIVDAAGAAVAKVTGLALRASNPATLFRSADSAARDWRRWLYVPVWREASLRPVARDSQRWAVFSDQLGIGSRLAQRLEARGDAVIVIARGDRDALDAVAAASAAGPLQVVDLRSLDSGASLAAGQSIPDAALDHAGHVLSILGATARAPLSGLWLVTRGAQAAGSRADLAVEQAPLWGLEKAIALEQPDLRGACIDLDPDGGNAPSEALAEADDEAAVIFDELSGAADRAGIAYRSGVRFEARLAAHELASSAPDAQRVRADATYLITGGFGALGSRVAQWLAANGARHLVLCGRRPPSARASEAIAAMERRGVRITVAQVDVSDSGLVHALMQTIAASSAPLRGVVHAAGVVEDATLAHFDPEALRRVFAPKVRGAWNLHTATAAMPLDFFVCFSSAASLIGSAGQGQYAAANAFLDSLAVLRRSMGLCGLSINWGAWSGGGMASETAATAQARWTARGVGSLPPESGLEILGRAIAGSAANLGVLPIDWDTYLPATYGARVPPLFEELAARPAATAAAAGQGPALDTLSVNEVRARLAEIVRTAVMATLGLRSAAAIDPRTSFFDLGLDSLTATELRHRLRSVLGYEINATVVFDYPSLERLVEHLLRQSVRSGAETNGLGTDSSQLEGRGTPAVPPAPRLASRDKSPDQPIEQAIANELAELESLLAGLSDE